MNDKKELCNWNKDRQFFYLEDVKCEQIRKNRTLVLVDFHKLEEKDR